MSEDPAEEEARKKSSELAKIKLAMIKLDSVLRKQFVIKAFINIKERNLDSTDSVEEIERAFLYALEEKALITGDREQEERDIVEFRKPFIRKALSDITEKDFNIPKATENIERAFLAAKQAFIIINHSVLYEVHDNLQRTSSGYVVNPVFTSIANTSASSTQPERPLILL